MTSTLAQATSILRQVPLLKSLDHPTLEGLGRRSLRRECDPGEIILLEGEPCAGLYIVESGWLKAVKVTPNGREQVMRLAGPGEAFNEVGFIVNSPNLVTIVALEPAVIWIIPRDILLQLMDERPGFARLVAQNLAERTLHMIRLVEDLSLRTVEARLSRVLLEQATSEAVERRPWSTQAEMAARIGTVPDVLNRALRDLVQAELVQVDRRQIRILNRQGLEERARLGI